MQTPGKDKSRRTVNKQRTTTRDLARHDEEGKEGGKNPRADRKAKQTTRAVHNQSAREGEDTPAPTLPSRDGTTTSSARVQVRRPTLNPVSGPILITADIHLSDQPRDAYRFTGMATIRRIAEENKVGAIFILGDLTEQKDFHSS